MDIKLHVFWSSPRHHKEVEWSVVLRLLYLHDGDGGAAADDDDSDIKPADLNISPRSIMRKGKSDCSQCGPFRAKHNYFFHKDRRRPVWFVQHATPGVLAAT